MPDDHPVTLEHARERPRAGDDREFGDREATVLAVSFGVAVTTPDGESTVLVVC